jgi:nitrous oxidase accessory protein NosD
MNNKQTGSMLILFVTVFVLCFTTTTEAASRKLNCGGNRTISAAINRLDPGDVLNVSGICSENLVIPENVHDVTINGSGTATINSPDPSRAAVTIRGTGITISGFTIMGGLEGILVHRNGVATITDNLITSNRIGIGLNQASSARIANNTIQNSISSGISVAENASVRVGFISFQPGVPGGVGSNTIQNNGSDGVIVSRSANAIILGNLIKGNARDGVRVHSHGQADIASNIIEVNGGNGINVSGTSAVNLGQDSGTAIEEAANSTSAGQANAGVGISCQFNSSMNGRLGTLHGVGGATTVGSSCSNSVIP